MSTYPAPVPTYSNTTGITGNTNATFAENKKITLTANTPTGGISKLIDFRTIDKYGRPWSAWYDYQSVLRAAAGWHETDYSSGEDHNAYEVKTNALTVPTDMRTRLSLGSGADRTLVGLNYVTFVEANQGEAANAVDFGYRLRAYLQDGSANGVVAQFLARSDASDNIVGSLDVMPVTVGATKAVTLQIFRNTSTGSASNPVIAVKKGDGSNTNALLFTAKTGKFELLLALSGTTGIILGADSVATLYRAAAGIVKTDGKIAATVGLGVGNSAAATIAVGTLAKKMEVFDTAGTSLGFVPIYSTIT